MINSRNFLLIIILALSQIDKAQNSSKISLEYSNKNLYSKIKTKSVGRKPVKKVLIIGDKIGDVESQSKIAVRQLKNLLGHFTTKVTIIGIHQYLPHLIKRYDAVFFVGSDPKSIPSSTFMNDVFNTKKTVVWMNSGIIEFGKDYNLKKKFWFYVSQLDSTKTYNIVSSGKKLYTREPDDLYIIQIFNKKKTTVLAYAGSDANGNRTPYIVKSNNFYYIADVPLMNEINTDRYLLFADLLHEMIGENHHESHNALVRIEDVTPLRDPKNLRNIADILSERRIPFLVGVIPFYVNPKEGISVSLSDRPEMVGALKYCVDKGATIVLHGVTHQYKGISAIDFEFWDGQNNKPIKNETQMEIENRIESGIDECVKNGIYPLIWETPHYMASNETYQTVSKYFSSSIERRLVDENSDKEQYFPYIINNDIYGEKIYPEDLGYLPLFQQDDSTEQYLQYMVHNAKSLLNVRDGYASFFFHPFIDLDYLKEIVDSICREGFTFVDLRKENNWVKTKDDVILSGSQTYTLNPNNSFLEEIYYTKKGKIEKRIYSDSRLKRTFAKKIQLNPGEFYVARLLKSTRNDITSKDKKQTFFVKNQHS